MSICLYAAVGLVCLLAFVLMLFFAGAIFLLILEWCNRGDHE